MSLAHIISDIFMAVFFLLVGLEIKYEMTVGELTNIRQAALPIIAAFGGVVMPIVIYSAFNAGDPRRRRAGAFRPRPISRSPSASWRFWAAVFPNGIRVFLSTLAVADDIIAILVIAVFYRAKPLVFRLALVAAVSWRCW